MSAENASLLSDAHGACPTTFNTTAGCLNGGDAMMLTAKPSTKPGLSDAQEFELADAEAYELRLAEAQLAATQDQIDAMWKEEQYWTVHKLFHDTYCNPNDPRRHVPQRHHHGDRFVLNTGRNNATADAFKKQMNADKQLIAALEKRNANSAKRRSKSGKAPSVDDKVDFLVSRGMEYCRTQWLDVDQQMINHQRVLDSIVADKNNWYMGTRFFVKGPWYFAPDDYRWQIDNADGHLNESCPQTVCKLKDSSKFYNHHVGKGEMIESFRGMRLRKEHQRLKEEKKLLEVAVNKLSGY